jgi:hypothetical protein
MTAAFPLADHALQVMAADQVKECLTVAVILIAHNDVAVRYMRDEQPQLGPALLERRSSEVITIHSSRLKAKSIRS